jgi:hypothetical protein
MPVVSGVKTLIVGFDESASSVVGSIEETTGSGAAIELAAAAVVPSNSQTMMGQIFILFHVVW